MSYLQNDQMNCPPGAGTPAQNPPVLALRPLEELPAVWYADRHFPTFQIELYDRTTGMPVTHVSGWKVGLSLTDGFGTDASDKMYDHIKNHTFEISNGMTAITGLRFTTVSSKFGGHFTLTVSVVLPDLAVRLVAPLVSGHIQVLSYRLYHAPKVPFSQLSPDDSVAKMKGIGALYAKRMAALGVGKVRELAAIDVDSMGEDAFQQLIANLRKDRGSMTPTKLLEHVQQARAIVQRWSQQQQQQQPEQSVQVIPSTPLNAKEKMAAWNAQGPVTPGISINDVPVQPASTSSTSSSSSSSSGSVEVEGMPAFPSMAMDGNADALGSVEQLLTGKPSNSHFQVAVMDLRTLRDLVPLQMLESDDLPALFGKQCSTDSLASSTSSQFSKLFSYDRDNSRDRHLPPPSAKRARLTVMASNDGSNSCHAVPITCKFKVLA